MGMIFNTKHTVDMLAIVNAAFQGASSLIFRPIAPTGSQYFARCQVLVGRIRLSMSRR